MSHLETLGRPLFNAEGAAPLLRIDRLSAGFNRQAILRGISLELPSRGVVGLMGPAGVGKTTLLRTLSRWNESLPSFWVRGKVELGGRDLLAGMTREECHRRVPVLAQKARLYTASILDNAIAEIRGDRPLGPREQRQLAFRALAPLGLWRELEPVLGEPILSLTIGRQRKLSIARLVANGAECLLADEPLRDVPEAERGELKALIRRLARRRSILMVTHNQRHARELCDVVCLMVEGRLVEVAETERFFGDPRTELAREFIRLGNCWPRKTAGEEDPEASGDMVAGDAAAGVPAPALGYGPRPGGFHWILIDRLGGMQRPGLLASEEQDLQALRDLGCRVLVSLTQEPYDPTKLRRAGIRGAHFPILDMGVPSHPAAADLCRRISRWIDRGLATVLHCKAGLGRTGTMLACILVYRGHNSVQAIDQVRSINPYYIQSPEQLAFVGSFSSHLERQPSPV